MKSNDLAYIAGFFDGEGCVSIQEPYNQPRPYLIFANNNEDVLLWIRDSLDAGIVYPPRQFRCHQLFLMKASEVVEAGNLLLPFLKVKNEQVQWAIEMGMLVESGIKNDLTLLKRFKIAAKIKEINQRRGTKCLLV